MSTSKRETSKAVYERFRAAYAERRYQDLPRTGGGGKRRDGDEPQDTKKWKLPWSQDGHLRSYLRWLWRYWPTTLLLIVLSLLVAALEMTHPLFMRFILDRVLLAEGASETVRLRHLHLCGLAFLGVVLLGQLLNVMKNYRTRQLDVRVVISLRRALFERMLPLPLDQLTKLKTGGIISRLTGDVNMTTGLLQLGLVSPGVSLVRLVIALTMLVYLNWQLALFGLTLIPVAVLVSFVVSKRIRPIYRSVRDDASYVDARVGETFGGIRIVRGFQRESTEEQEHAVGRHAIVRKKLFAHRRELALWTVWGGLLASINLVAMWFGGVLQIRGQATIGDIMAFQWYAMLLLNPVWQIVNTMSELQRSLAAMERVFDVLESEVDKPDRPDAREAPQAVETLHFDHVSFEYVEGTRVLKDFDLQVPGGATVALVGRSGAGKTTVADLVARFCDPSEGSIRLNGIDLRDLRLASYRNLLGIVQQETFLFDGSVSENIAYGRPSASQVEIIDAACRANAHEFIEVLEDGYDTVIGERGVRLSGGQAQRLAIARALLADPQILILDEATSNLDSESEQLIQRSLDELLRGRTTFVIAHRLSTIAEADQIVVLEDGEIVEMGTHEQLLGGGRVYAQMVARQQEAMSLER